MLEIGPKKRGLMPMNARYTAFEILMVDPDVPNVSATSGTADKMAVEDMGERNPQIPKMNVIAFFLRFENRL
jgi:hypothetical protein